MLSAKEARYESKYRQKINEILKRCEESVKEASLKGEYSCYVSLNCTIGEVMREELFKTFYGLGYKCEITDVNTKYKDAPMDQRDWYDSITLNWKEAEK